MTRFKRNASLRGEHLLPILEYVAGSILEDAIVRFANHHPTAGRKNPYDQDLWRETMAQPNNDQPLVLATNDLGSPAAVIAQRYKDRWGIELFFKWIKQRLRIRNSSGIACTPCAFRS